ncbi:MAG: AsmA family protein, partial [Candidatus Riflebacteria bacterium]|nr:AsmA family protein [Candidatus Riflebacteria bacterium]
MDAETPSSPSSPTPIGPEPQSETADHPPTGRPVLRIIGTILIVVLLLVAGAGYYVYTRFLNLGNLKEVFESKAGAYLGLPVRVASLALDFPTIRLTGVQLGDPASEAMPAATVDLVSVTPDFWELVKGNVLIESLYVASAEVRLVRDASGTVVLPPALAGAPAPATPAPTPAPAFDPRTLPLNLLEIERLGITLIDREAGLTRRAALAKASFSKASFGRGMPFAVALGLDGLGTIDLTGTVLADGGVTATLKTGEVALPGLPAWGVALPALPPGVASPSIEVQAQRQPDGSIRVSRLVLTCQPGLRLESTIDLPSLSPLAASGTVTLNPVGVEVLLPLARPYLPDLQGIELKAGQLGGGARFRVADGKMAELTAWAQPHGLVVKAPQVPVPVSLADGRVSYVEGVVQWSDLGVEVSGLKLASREGSFTPGPSPALAAEVKASLQLAPTFKDFLSVVPKDLKFLAPSGALEFAGKARLADGQAALDGTLGLTGVQVTPQPGMAPVVVEKAEFKADGLGAKTGRLVIASCRARVLDTPLEATGEVVNGADPKLALQASGVADLARLQAALPVENELFKKKTRLAGKAVLSGKVTGTLKNPEPEGVIRLDGAEFHLEERQLHLTGISGTARGTPARLALEKLVATVAGARLQVDGALTDLKNPTIQGKATVGGLELAEVRSFLAGNFPTFPADLDFTGRVDLDCALSGPAATPQMKGSAVLAGASVFHPAMMRRLANIVGPVQFDNQGLKTEGLRTDWGSSTLNLKGKVDSWATFGLDFAYDIDPLDLTDIGQFFLAGTGYGLTGRGTALGRVTGPIGTFLLAGTAKVPAGVIETAVSKGASTFKFPFKDLTAPFTFANKVLEVKGAQLGLFSGTVQASGKAWVAETPIRFSFDTKGTGLQAQEFLALNTGYKNVLTGGVDLTFGAQGNTTGLSSLDGLWSVGMKSGKYQAPPVAAQLFTLLNAPQLSSGDLSNLAGTFLFKGGQMHSDDLLFKSPVGQMSYKGNVGLDTSLDGTAQLVLPREVCQGSPVLSQLVGKRPTLELPVGVKGSLAAPSINLALDKLLKKAVEEQVKDKAQDLLLNALTGGKKAPATASGTAPTASGTVQPAKPTAGKLLENELGKLLGIKTPTPAPVASPAAPVPAPAPQPAPAPA